MIAIALALAIALADSTGAEALTGTYHALQPNFAASPLGRSLYLESEEREGRVSGDVYAIVQHPFGQLRSGLATPVQWCEVLILHLNVKQCNAGPGTVQLVVGRKQAESGEGNATIDFSFAVRESSVEHFDAVLQADNGPLGTHAYRLALESIPLAAGTSFLRLSYSYAYGTAAALAMDAYLRTIGKDKVGFSVTGATPDGAPLYVHGLRGTLERNTMRYYLAIDTYLDSVAWPPADRPQRRFETWYAATEQYPRQLHELTRAEYLARKKSQ